MSFSRGGVSSFQHLSSLLFLYDKRKKNELKKELKNELKNESGFIYVNPKVRDDELDKTIPYDKDSFKLDEKIPVFTNQSLLSSHNIDTNKDLTKIFGDKYHPLISSPSSKIIYKKDPSQYLLDLNDRYFF